MLEAAIRVDDALRAADKAALFKTYTKILAQRRGWMATFMAKWSRDWPGQSGHLHVSLRDLRTGKGAFHDAKGPHGMSQTMRWFVGGQQHLMPELLAMVACTVNSYTRLIPGFWAPTDSAWGVENRTTALRVIPGSEKSQRVEYRVAAADINPYIALAAAIGSGLWGIENRIDPGEPIAGNAYEVKHPKERALPRSLGEAAERLKASQAARGLFGDTFVDHYASTREWEEREARKAITDWQLARYFEDHLKTMPDIICISPADGRAFARRSVMSGGVLDPGLLDGREGYGPRRLLSPLGYLAVTRPKSYHLRSLEPLDRPGSGPAGDDL